MIEKISKIRRLQHTALAGRKLTPQDEQIQFQHIPKYSIRIHNNIFSSDIFEKVNRPIQPTNIFDEKLL